METQDYYLKEFHHFNGEYYITFNIVNVDFDKKTIKVAITDTGKISVIEYDLLQDKYDNFYFLYGHNYEKINLEDFETVED